MNRIRYEIADKILKDIKERTGEAFMARFCMDCGVYMGLKPGFGVSGPTHGTCKPCLQKRMESME